MKYPKEYFIKWRENNREKTRKSAEKYRSKHPERILKLIKVQVAYLFLNSY